MDRDYYMPQKDGALYQILLNIFEDEDRVDVDLADVAENINRFVSGGVLFFGSNNKATIVTNHDDFYPLMWVVLKIQPNRSIGDKRLAQEIANYIEAHGYDDWGNETREHFIFNQFKEIFKKRSTTNLKKRTPSKVTPKGVTKGSAEAKALLAKWEEEKRQEEKDEKEFKDEIGQEYFRRIMDEFLKGCDVWPVLMRVKFAEVLQGLCAIDGVPGDVKEKIKGLAIDKSNGMTVNTKTYVEKQEINCK